MKIICSKCHSKYAISDERVKGKTLHIKCKKCGSMIEARDPALKSDETRGSDLSSGADSASSTDADSSILEKRFAGSFMENRGNKGTPGLYRAVQQSAKALEKGEAGLPIWFVAVDGKSEGPVSALKIRHLQKTGKVTVSSLVWKEGQLDWIPLSECESLCALLAGLRTAEEASPDEQPSADVPRLGLFVDTGGASPLVGHKTLAEEKTDTSDMTVPSEKTAASASETMGGGLEPEDFPRVTSLIPAAVSLAGRKWKVLTAVAFFVASVAVLILVLVMTGRKPETIIKERVIEKTQVVYKDRPLGTAVDVAADQPSDTPVKSRRASAGSPTVQRTPTTTPVGPETAEERKNRLLAELSEPGVGGSAPASGGGNALSQTEMSRVVSKNRASLQSCYERAMKAGNAPTDRDLKVTFDVSVGMSGMVRSVTATGAATAYPTLKNCFESSVRKWVFPASQGNSAVQFPIVFTPAR